MLLSLAFTPTSCYDVFADISHTEGGDFVNKEFFPSNYTEALALEWVRRAVGETASPEDLIRLYWQAWYRITAADRSAAEEAKRRYEK